MDREDALDLVIEGIVLLLLLNKDGEHPGLPIVDVDDVGLEVHELEELFGGESEESETFAIVIEAIDRIAVKVIIVRDEVIGDPIDVGPIDFGRLLAPAHVDVESAEAFDFELRERPDLVIERKNRNDLFPFDDKFLGERVDDVSEAARFH
ncbi:MAG: hypothetical protein BWY98_01073 [Tenericutes bacterium ADurb.BinA155]|nr:MAG: hypothetical protein BWY98_01073 [Tenericutes bacterium ADurb.BinA155]